MREDDVLGQVRDHIRAERADDAALEAAARGEEGSAAVADLERRAAEDPELAAALALSRPLGAGVEERIAARVGRKAGPPRAEPAAPAGPRLRGSVSSLARRVAVVAGPLALAAAVLLWVLVGRSGDPGGALLPDYAVSATSDQAMRGATSATPSARLTLHGGDAPFEIVLRPATSAGAKVVAYAFAIGDGEPNPIEAKIEIAPEGSIRIRGRARALEGAREVRVVVGIANDSIKRFDDALARARDGTGDAHARVLVVAITRE